MKIMELKCPNCGALVQRETMKCQYCGAALVLRNDVLSLRNSIACPKCGTMVGEGAFFCNNCEELLSTIPEDLSFLRTTLRKTKLLQDNWKGLINQVDGRILEKLEKDELIYQFMPSGSVTEGSLPNAPEWWTVTNKKVLRYSGGSYIDISLEDVAFVNEPIEIRSTNGKSLYEVRVSTFQAEFSFFQQDYENAYGFSEMCAMAHREFEDARDLKKKDTIVLLWKHKDKLEAEG